MIFRFLADSVLVFHLGFILFAVLGGLLAFRARGVRWLHLPAALWAVLIQFGGWTCPLTPLENRLRPLGGQAGYQGGFLEHYLLSVLYPDGLTRGVQLVLGFFVLSLNLWVYWRLFRPRRATARTTAHPLGPAVAAAAEGHGDRP